MLQKLKEIRITHYIKQLQDVRVTGLLVFGVIAILVTWSGVSAIASNYELQKQVSQLEQQNSVQQLQNTNLELQNEYYNTSEYQELQSRLLFGKGAPGEKLIIVPQSVAESKLAPVAVSPTITTTTPPPKPTYQKNFEAWVDFFFHRNS